ncbi:XRE family transcriptional regulator [Thermosipho sp. 1070]|nr:XRE family transcriptional regulator [Thermosipho sp. 1070]
MKKTPDMFIPVFEYGAFARPFIVQMINMKLPKAVKYSAVSLLYTWEGKYSQAIQYVNKAIRFCNSESMRFFLLARKLSCKSKLGEFDPQLYRCLKSNLNKVSGKVREEIEMLLINVKARYEKKSVSEPRIWGSNKTSSAFVFYYLGKARNSVAKNDVPHAVHHYIQAYKLSKTIPHPSGVVSSLNDLAWDIKNIHPLWAYSISQKAVYWLGYYRETSGNLFGALDTLFVIEKKINTFSIYRTSKVIRSLGVSKKYEKLLKEVERYIPKFNVSIYANTKDLRRFIRKIVGLCRGEKISAGRISEIITGKTKRIRGNTLKKIIEGKEVENLEVPYPVYNERIKLKVEERFEKALEELKQLTLSERKRLFISTYIAQVEREKFYLSRKDKLKKSYKLLENVEEFGKYMARRYKTMEFVVDMVEAHPYVEGRKTAVRKAVDRMGVKKLGEFIRRYIELDEYDRKLLDRFMRNYGRYDGIRFGMRVNGSEVVRGFAKKYRLEIQPTLLAYWCEDDKRVRGRLERILNSFF